MGLTSRRKGAAFECEVARILTAASGVKWGRTLMGEEQSYGDVVPKGPVGAPWDGLFVEAKAHSSVKPEHLLKPCEKMLTWWAKARREASEVERTPVLFIRFRGWGVAALVPESNSLGAHKTGWCVWGENWFAFDAEALR